ncbi:MAG: hypothetical protein KC563_16185, partial [Nitrospira sp.]|nr:hypothetical protein [Nitrospira sp.]MCA9477322.1 hypothetical protein [Nitrospira sp.]
PAVLSLNGVVGSTFGLATKEGLADCLLCSGKPRSNYVWTSSGNRKGDRHLSCTPSANLVKQWTELARLNPKRHSTQSIHRPKSVLIYDQMQTFAACRTS